MSRPIVFGQPSYPHVRSILFALTEKDVAYRVQASEAVPLLDAYASAISNLGEPLIELGGRIIRGTETILRFVEDTFSGPQLQPSDAIERARMNRALELNYREAVITLGSRIAGRYLAGLVNEWLDPTPSEVLANARRTVGELEEILKDGPFFAGAVFSLADIALSSLLDTIMETPDGDLIAASDSNLRRWWSRVSAREAFQLTRPKGCALFGFLHAA
jgi:glutathione S-transferase